MPLLLRVLAGNPVTSAAVLGCLNTADASRLRQLHPAVAGVVADVPWCDMGTKVTDVVRWRAAFPAAEGVWVSQRRAGRYLAPPALAALAGITNLSLVDCKFTGRADELLLHLPASLCTLNVNDCHTLTSRANLTHLTALTTLRCSDTLVLDGGAARLPASLQKLECGYLPEDLSLAHLAHLQVLRTDDLSDVTFASLPPSLLKLYLKFCRRLALTASFAHLPALHTLGVSGSDLDDATLASMPPPSLVSLFARECTNLTSDAVLPPLPSLRQLDVSGTDVGDALVASLPAGLMELRLVDCRGVTEGATLDHLPALRMLQSLGTDLAPGALAACRARGCVVRRKK